METVQAASRRCNLRWQTVSHNSKEGQTTTLVVLDTATLVMTAIAERTWWEVTKRPSQQQCLAFIQTN